MITAALTGAVAVLALLLLFQGFLAMLMMLDEPGFKSFLFMVVLVGAFAGALVHEGCDLARPPTAEGGS